MDHRQAVTKPGFAVELKSGDWLTVSAEGSMGSAAELADAKVFPSVEEAVAYSQHLGLSIFDVWSSDGDTWVTSRGRAALNGEIEEALRFGKELLG
jgi:hypothetical protein